MGRAPNVRLLFVYAGRVFLIEKEISDEYAATLDGRKHIVSGREIQIFWREFKFEFVSDRRLSTTRRTRRKRRERLQRCRR